MDGIDKSIACLRTGQFGANEASLECLDHVFTLYTSGAYADAKTYAEEMLLQDAQSPRDGFAWLAASSNAAGGKSACCIRASLGDGRERQGERVRAGDAAEVLQGDRVGRAAAGGGDAAAGKRGGDHQSTPAAAVVGRSARGHRKHGRPAVPLSRAAPPLPRAGHATLRGSAAGWSRSSSQMLGSPALGVRTVLTRRARRTRRGSTRASRTWSCRYDTQRLPPSIEQTDIAMGILTDAASLPFLLHCGGGGKGRATHPLECPRAPPSPRSAPSAPAASRRPPNNPSSSNTPARSGSGAALPPPRRRRRTAHRPARPRRPPRLW